jgi:UDP-N-acetylmuramyl pentapeptide synthase
VVACFALSLPIHRVYPVGSSATAAFAGTGDSRVRVLPRDAIAADVADDLATEADAVVLVKGSRGMRLEDVADDIVARSRCTQP